MPVHFTRRRARRPRRRRRRCRRRFRRHYYRQHCAHHNSHVYSVLYMKCNMLAMALWWRGLLSQVIRLWVYMLDVSVRLCLKASNKLLPMERLLFVGKMVMENDFRHFQEWCTLMHTTMFIKVMYLSLNMGILEHKPIPLTQQYAQNICEMLKDAPFGIHFASMHFRSVSVVLSATVYKYGSRRIFHRIRSANNHACKKSRIIRHCWRFGTQTHTQTEKTISLRKCESRRSACSAQCSSTSRTPKSHSTEQHGALEWSLIAPFSTKVVHALFRAHITWTFTTASPPTKRPQTIV